jgi:hypothetical protein
MQCSNCGAVNDDSLTVCRACGTPLVGSGEREPYDRVPSYLAQSILVTIFCCMPLGVVAIVFAAISMSRDSSGDYAGALEAARTARTWCWASFIVGLVWVVALVCVYLLAGVAGLIL